MKTVGKRYGVVLHSMAFAARFIGGRDRYKTVIVLGKKVSLSVCMLANGCSIPRDVITFIKVAGAFRFILGRDLVHQIIVCYWNIYNGTV
jgi:hypothetical protein